MHLTIKKDDNGYNYLTLGQGYMLFRGQRFTCDKLISPFATDDPAIAKQYGNNFCCYNTKRELRLFLMDIDNVEKIIRDENIEVETTVDYNNFKGFLEDAFLDKGKYRASNTVSDYIVTKTLCDTLWKKLNYDGYYAFGRQTHKTIEKLDENGNNIRIKDANGRLVKQVEEIIGSFHREVALCEPDKVLEQCNTEPKSLEEIMKVLKLAKLDCEYIVKQLEIMKEVEDKSIRFEPYDNIIKPADLIEVEEGWKTIKGRFV